MAGHRGRAGQLLIAGIACVATHACNFRHASTVLDELQLESEVVRGAGGLLLQQRDQVIDRSIVVHYYSF